MRTPAAQTATLFLMAGAALGQPAPPMVTSPQCADWYLTLLESRLAAC